MRDDLVSTTPLSSGSASDNKEFSGIEAQVVALIAHDALKSTMIKFAVVNFDILSRYSGRVATGI